MTITYIDLCQLTRAIWESTLGLEVQPIPGAGLSEQQAGIVTGRVQITGAWLGAVLLECSEELAKKVAHAMFGLDSNEPTPEEVRDALAEITNVTATSSCWCVGIAICRCRRSSAERSTRRKRPIMS